MSAAVWTVEAKDQSGAWTVWSAWVDRATAEAEKDNAEDLGYTARIVVAR